MTNKKLPSKKTPSKKSSSTKVAPKNTLTEPDSFKVGDVVYVTMSGHDFITRNRPEFNVNIAGRMARVHDIYDWKSTRGKKILAERAKLPKWKDRISEDYKYVLVIYYPELKKEDTQGLSIPELFTEFHPMQAEPKIRLFRKWDDELLSDMFSASDEYSLTRQGT